MGFWGDGAVVEDVGLFKVEGKCLEGVECGLVAGLTNESGLESSDRLYSNLTLAEVSSLGE